MAIKSKKKTKKSTKKKNIELTLWDVNLSFPDIANPQPFKGKTYYRTDVIMKPKSQALKSLQNALDSIYTAWFGDDESEWPTPETKNEKPHIQNGDEREDQKGYTGNRFIVAKTQSPVPVIDLDEKAFNPKLVKGGMFANVAVSVSYWEFDGDEGVTIYLQGIQIDTEKPALNYGGGRSVKAMFKRGEDEDDFDADEDSDDEDEEEEERRPSKNKKPSRDEDEDEEEEEEPVRKKKKRPVREEEEDEDEEEEDERPTKKRRRPSRDFDDED